MNKFVVVFLCLVSTAAMAGGGERPAQPKDLMDLLIHIAWPAANVLLLFGFILWKVLGPLKKMFDENSNKVKQAFEFSEEKSKEANIKLQMYQEKMDNLHNEKAKMEKEANEDFENYKKENEKETSDRISRIHSDSDSKLEFEKKMGEQKIIKEMLEEVITKSKSKIKGSKDSRDKVTSNLVGNLK